MHLQALSTTLVVAIALSASAAVSAPVPRDNVETVSFAPLTGTVMVARAKTKGKAPAPAAPAQPAAGSGLQLVKPASTENQVSNPAGVQDFLNPSDPKTGKHLDKALDDASSGRGGTLHSLDKNGNMPVGNGQQKTGFRLDGQGGSPAGQQANVQVQANGTNGGKSTCATCIVHTNSGASGADVKDALTQSSQTDMIAHLWRRMLELFR